MKLFHQPIVRSEPLYGGSLGCARHPTAGILEASEPVEFFKKFVN
jgi:hypothetical protein